MGSFVVYTFRASVLVYVYWVFYSWVFGGRRSTPTKITSRSENAGSAPTSAPETSQQGEARPLSIGGSNLPVTLLV